MKTEMFLMLGSESDHNDRKKSSVKQILHYY